MTEQLDTVTIDGVKYECRYTAIEDSYEGKKFIEVDLLSMWDESGKEIDWNSILWARATNEIDRKLNSYDAQNWRAKRDLSKMW